MAMLPAWADSISLGGLLDTDHGRSIDLHGRFSPTEALTLGAGIGSSTTRQGSDELSGNSFEVSADLDAGPIIADASAERWTDSGVLRSTTLHGELGWLGDSGIALSALVTHRDMRVTYTTTLLGQPRDKDVDFAGTGFGADLSYFGETWNSGVRFLRYDYGQSVERARQALAASSTVRFPRLAQLIGSVATQAAGAPDREFSGVLGRQIAGYTLTGDLQWQRDAVTGDKTKSAGLTLGLKPATHVGVDVSAGVSRNATAGTVPWAGFTLTLLRAAPPR